MIRSPASCRDCSTESTTMTSALATASSSSSRLCAWLAPMALMCAPGARSAPLTTGCAAVVAVETMSAPRTASAADEHGCTRIPSRSDISLQKFSSLAASRPYARADSSFRTVATASSCVFAWPPVPMIAAHVGVLLHGNEARGKIRCGHVVKKTSARQFESPARVHDNFPRRLLARTLFHGLHCQRHRKHRPHFRLADMQRHLFTLRLILLTSECARFL